MNKEFRIEVLGCEGQTVRAYQSTGKVSNSRNSDGYYFMDKATGKLVEVSGTVVLTECDGCAVPEQKPRKDTVALTR